MTLAGAKTVCMELKEVDNVLSDNGALTVVRPRQERAVRESGKAADILYGYGVVAASAELLRNRWAVHLIDEQPHLGSGSRPRLHRSSASEAYSRSRAIH